MQALSVESINKAIQLCQENKSYSVLVYVRHDNDFVDIIWPILQEGIYDITSGNHKYIIKFKNGSNIVIIGPSSNKCGIRADLVLYDQRVSDDKNILNVLRCFESKNIDFKLSTKFKEEI